jgi:hypothetical protein
LLDLRSKQLTQNENDANVNAAAFSSDEQHYSTGYEGLLNVWLTALPKTLVASLRTGDE